MWLGGKKGGMEGGCSTGQQLQLLPCLECHPATGFVGVCVYSVYRYRQEDSSGREGGRHTAHQLQLLPCLGVVLQRLRGGDVWEQEAVKACSWASRPTGATQPSGCRHCNAVGVVVPRVCEVAGQCHQHPDHQHFSSGPPSTCLFLIHTLYRRPAAHVERQVCLMRRTEHKTTPTTHEGQVARCSKQTPRSQPTQTVKNQHV